MRVNEPQLQFAPVSLLITDRMTYLSAACFSFTAYICTCDRAFGYRGLELMKQNPVFVVKGFACLGSLIRGLVEGNVEALGFAHIWCAYSCRRSKRGSR